MRNPGIKPEDKEWLWGEIPSASPQAPGTIKFNNSLEETQEKEKAAKLEI